MVNSKYVYSPQFPNSERGLVQVPIVKRVAAAVVKQTETGAATPAVAR